MSEFTDAPAAPAQRSLHGARARYPGGLHEVAPETWAWLQPNGDLGESNAGLIAGGEHVLLVDTLWDLHLTRRMIAAARDAGIAMPETVFNTHSDGDHCWGNQLFPEAEIISSSAAKKLMTLDTPAELRLMQRGSRLLGAVGRLPLPVVGSLNVPKLPRLPLREMGGLMTPFDWSEIELTLPTRTFDESLAIEVGGRVVELTMVGPAHTGGDSIAWVPDVSVCFAADVLFIDCTPITWAGPVAGWLRALDTLMALDAETFVPGHGPVCGRTEVALLREYFEWTVAEGVSQLERGTGPVRAARNMLLSDEFESLPWAAWEDPARLVVTLSTEQYVRGGGRGHLVGAGRSRAVMHMQRTKADLARRRKAVA